MGLTNMFLDYASRPNVQQKFAKMASSGAEKAMRYAQNNPNKVKSLASKGFNFAKQASRNPELQDFMMGTSSMGKGNLDDRVSALERKVGMLMSSFGGRRTRKQKRKARKTRKH